MNSVRFDLPAGYSLCTRHRGFAFTYSSKTYGTSAHDGVTPAVLRDGDEAVSPFLTPGAAVRGIIRHADLTGEDAARLERQIAALPEKFR